MDPFFIVIFLLAEIYIYYDIARTYYLTDTSLTMKTILGEKEMKIKDIEEICKKWLVWSGYCYFVIAKDGKKIPIRETVRDVDDLIKRLKEVKS